VPVPGVMIGAAAKHCKKTVDSCEARVSLHFTQLGFLIPMPAGVVVEKGSEYILAHTGPRELDGHPLEGMWSGSDIVPGYYPFGKGPSQH